MRLLTLPEINSVAGGETTTVTIPAGFSVTVTPMANGTVTLGLFQGNSLLLDWNSGVAAGCAAIGLGAGMMSLAFTGGNGVAAMWVGRAAAFGCNAALNNPNPPPR
ncbi:hypothetical protein [Pseudoduganella chitinolytica]|uniref:Uncharacterized protein n=1 Tax=Pseudoduganella chitinolytica TaxID=34070 RepID=A0ABY8BJR7_9BURK|nr:hypothetical protein [Pseudoduganella chitinolytica]WEF35203.1 hypothetical protein PX653_10725 [Pseudoduganella chitinolytica]